MAATPVRWELVARDKAAEVLLRIAEATKRRGEPPR